MEVNTKYKDSFFSFLFNHSDVLRELYSALQGISIPQDIPITVNTLKNVLFFDRINDVSFEIGDKLVVLIEHQSSISPNLTLRLLMYITRVYEQILESKNIHTKRRLLIPRPEFFVLYNGIVDYPDEKILKLSESYEEAGEFLGYGKENLSLELTAKVININAGRNEDKLQKCQTLAGYSIFVAKVREYQRLTGIIEEGINLAIKYCLEYGILKEIFEEKAMEVKRLMITEWNLEEVLTIRFEDGIEIGREEGREENRKEVARKALENGATIEFIHNITGLDIEAIMSLQP